LQLSIKSKLNQGGLLVGTYIKLNNAPIVEMFGYTDYDFIIVDGRHSAYSYESVMEMIRAANGVGMAAIVRLPSNQEEHILHTIDLGAQGILMPVAENLSEIESAVDYMRYAPIGRLDFAMTTRSGGYGLYESDAYIEMFNNAFTSMVMIENLQMAGRIKEICSIRNVDVIFIGVESISAEMGKRGQTNDPEVLAVVRGITETALDNGKYLGAYAGSIEEAALYEAWGMHMIAYSSDLLIASKRIQQVYHALEALKLKRNSTIKK
jgi:4-hydroxy-2-oxoheptanedioate aldolase